MTLVLNELRLVLFVGINFSEIKDLDGIQCFIQKFLQEGAKRSVKNFRGGAM